MGLFNRKTVTEEKAPEREKTKIFVFTGTVNGMLPYHVASLLEAVEKEAEILLIDNTAEQDLFTAVSPKEGIGMANGCYVLSNRSYTEEAVKRFDYVIVNLGKRFDEEWAMAADWVFYGTDYTLESAEYLSGLPVKEAQREAAVLFLERATGKIREKDLLRQFPFAAKGTPCLICDASREDRAGYIGFLYNGQQKLSSMSADWKAMISEICILAANGKESDYRKLAKTA